MEGDLILVASGRSVLDYNLRDMHKHGTVLGVNGASLYVRCDIALTMDRLIAENYYPIWQTQGVPEIWIRDCVIKNFKPGPDVHPFRHTDTPPDEMSMETGLLVGTNSGMCGFNLALQKKPKRLFLLGLDMCRQSSTDSPYWHPLNAWSIRGGSKDGWLRAWAEEFRRPAKLAAKLGIQVYSVNHLTQIDAFPVIKFHQFMGMT